MKPHGTNNQSQGFLLPTIINGTPNDKLKKYNAKSVSIFFFLV